MTGTLQDCRIAELQEGRTKGSVRSFLQCFRQFCNPAILQCLVFVSVVHAQAPAPAGGRGGSLPASAPSADIKTLHVQGNVHLLVGAGGNVAVQVGDEGVLVVDPGLAQTSDKVLAAIRQLSDKPIRWILNTHVHPDHTGANEAVSKAGSTVSGLPAAIMGHEQVLTRMTDAGLPAAARPLNTYYGETKDFFFNGEPIVLYHDPAAHTDGDSIVFFRRSDVIVAGDVYVTTMYPVIDLKNGGGVQGVINGLNRILSLAVPEHQQEGGTFVIAGHGRVSDEADVLEYRDMVVIVRDRIRDSIKKGMTLDQVKAARPTLDYDRQYGADTGPWTTAMFIESVYRDLSQKR
jgi:glyoxylase-like metal-dependent hydrolase (beta-lactamase superfamily II)